MSAIKMVNKSTWADTLGMYHSNASFNGNNSLLDHHGRGGSGDYGVEFWFNGILIPIICLFGILGNLLNLAILTWRYNHREIDVLERGALLGLIALALSDFFFCLGMTPNVVYYDDKVDFYSKNFYYFYQLYRMYIHNVFIKISTWLTMIIATARYIAICHPLHARIFAGLSTTKAAIILTYLYWMLLYLPMLWIYQVHEIPLETGTMYVLDLGAFQTWPALKPCFTYLWAFTGYFIPIAILTFCNVNLIHALRESRKWRESSIRSNAPSGRDSNLRITLTLIALILMFLVLVSPAEILHFYEDVVEKNSFPSFWMATIGTNILQAVNFAFHFVLYCAVNVTFRRTIINGAYILLSKLRGKPAMRTLAYRRSLSGTRGANASFKSVETHV